MAAELADHVCTRCEKDMTVTRLRNFRTSVFKSNVSRTIGNGLHMAAMNTAAVLATNFLNAWMQDRGMTNRSFALTVTPNPQPQAQVNPLKRTY